MTREEFEAQARTGHGIGAKLDDGTLTIVPCRCQGNASGYRCVGWRLAPMRWEPMDLRGAR